MNKLFNYFFISFSLLACIPATALAGDGVVLGGPINDGGITILYRADAGILNKTNPLSLRTTTIQICFFQDPNKCPQGLERDTNKPLSELINIGGATILEITRVFNTSGPGTATMWFTYTR